MWSTAATLASLLSLSSGALATITYKPTDVANKTYDFIIAGGGLSGSVLANRLSASGAYKVLLVEAGLSDLDTPTIAVPQLAFTLWPDTAIDWNFTTVATKYVNNRVTDYPRGRALGGSTDINYLLQNKGSTEFWTQLATATGDSGWTYANMKNTYLKKYETWNHPMDGTSDAGQYTPSVHGTSGPIQISTANYHWSSGKQILSAAGQAPGFAFNQDSNAGNMLGLSYTQMNQGGGVRSNAALGYLHTGSVDARTNLDILLNTTVTKFLYSSTKSGAVVASGISFAQSSTSPVYSAKASKEVISALGGIMTPIVLKLSGIGPAAELTKWKIPIVINNTNVGAHFQDHPRAQIWYQMNGNYTFDDEFRYPDILNDDLTEWSSTHKGPMSQAPCTAWNWNRVALPSGTVDPSPGGNSPHYEVLFCDGYAGPPPVPGYFVSTEYVLISPQSRGTVTLSSGSVWTNPLVDPQFLSTTWDVTTMAAAINSTRNFLMNSPNLGGAGFVTGTYGPAPWTDISGAASATPAQYETFLRNNVVTLWHPTSTAMMDKTAGVVAPNFIVRGTKNLRVIDASIFPYCPSGHPMGMLYAVTERAADMILAAYA